MRYRLGAWSHRLGSAVSLSPSLFRPPVAAREESEVHAALLRMMRPPRRDLFDVLEPGDPDFEWLLSVDAGLSAVRDAGGSPRILDCEYVPGPEGFLALVGLDPTRSLDVRLGDKVTAGFAALRDARGELELWPRVYRVACTNGELVLDSKGAGLLEETGSPARGVEACLAPELLGEAAESFRRLADERVDDALSLLSGMSRRDQTLSIAERFEEARDFTRWGLLNAVTAEARQASDLRGRLDLERIGALLLQRTSRDPAYG